MDLPKEFLRQYIFVVAVNAGMMDEQLAAKIKAYDRETFPAFLASEKRSLRSARMILSNSLIRPTTKKAQQVFVTSQTIWQAF